MCFGWFDHEGVDGGCTFQLTSGVSFVHFRPLSWHIPKVRDMYVLFLIFWSNIVKKACTIYILNTKRGNGKQYLEQLLSFLLWKPQKYPEHCGFVIESGVVREHFAFYTFLPSNQTFHFRRQGLNPALLAVWTSSKLSGPRLHLYLALCSCDWINKKAS